MKIVYRITEEDYVGAYDLFATNEMPCIGESLVCSYRGLEPSFC